MKLFSYVLNLIYKNHFSPEKLNYFPYCIGLTSFTEIIADLLPFLRKQKNSLREGCTNGLTAFSQKRSWNNVINSNV